MPRRPIAPNTRPPGPSPQARPGPSLVMGLLLSALLAASCGPKSDLTEGDGDPVPFTPPSETTTSGVDPNAMLTPGGLARVTADSLNLRDGIGTNAAILTAMPCGAAVQVLDGPSTTPAAGWWHVDFTTPDASHLVGWASGKFLVADAAYLASTCGANSDGGAGAPSTLVSEIFDRAKLAVGYSYWWGHGAWRSDGADHGSCAGSCPSCTHTGSYGADCSGFITKAWQVPSASALAVDQHPYSTLNFYNEQNLWTQLPRASIQPADAMVRRSATSGHIVLFESGGDPYGDVWLYEARGCSSGVTHNLRSIDSGYRTIRRNGL